MSSESVQGGSGARRPRGLAVDGLSSWARPAAQRPHRPLNKVLKDPFADGMGYHGSAEEPSILAGEEPGPRRRSRTKKSTIVATEQVGPSTTAVPPTSGTRSASTAARRWKQGKLPITIQGGQADTCGGPHTRASDTVTAYDERHDVWLISTLGLSGDSEVPAVMINRGNGQLRRRRRHRLGARRSASTSRSPGVAGQELDHVRQLAKSKGYGNCYVEWDNNGNGNREIVQYSTDGGLTWIPPRPTT